MSYVAEVTDEYRRAINRYYGRDGMATRDEVKLWLEMYGECMNADLMQDFSDRTAADEWPDDEGIE